MVSVIIPSYNSEDTISAVLRALHNQTYKGEYEIILLDSSNDKTPEIVQKEFPDVIFHHFDKKTDPGTARNLGVQKSRGNLILFIDSDCRATSDWIEKIVESHKNHPYAAIGGAVLNGNDVSSEIAWAGYLAEFREYLPEQQAGIVDHIPTCNLSYKKEAFMSIEPFNANYYPQEDLEFNYRLKQQEMQVYLNPEIHVYHHHRTTLKSLFTHQKRIGKITAKMLKILPLSGAFIARNPLVAIFAIPFLPMVKLFKTLIIFLKRQPKTVFKHFPAVIIFAIGLLPWIVGFTQGVFSGKETD
jgi:glycosyltransferase involved in cell wall biosynthesis